MQILTFVISVENSYNKKEVEQNYFFFIIDNYNKIKYYNIEEVNIWKRKKNK